MTIAWDERLITRERAANLCGEWNLHVDYPYLRCSICDGNVMMFPSAGKLFNTDGIIAAVLGHMVKCHNYNLSGVGNG